MTKQTILKVLKVTTAIISSLLVITTLLVAIATDLEVNPNKYME